MIQGTFTSHFYPLPLNERRIGRMKLTEKIHTALEMPMKLERMVAIALIVSAVALLISMGAIIRAH